MFPLGEIRRAMSLSRFWSVNRNRWRRVCRKFQPSWNESSTNRCAKTKRSGIKVLKRWLLISKACVGGSSFSPSWNVLRRPFQVADRFLQETLVRRQWKQLLGFRNERQKLSRIPPPAL